MRNKPWPILICFWVLVYAGASDAVDGFIAKRYNLSSKLGGYLDPIADKALLISVFISLDMCFFMLFFVTVSWGGREDGQTGGGTDGRAGKIFAMGSPMRMWP